MHRQEKIKLIEAILRGDLRTPGFWIYHSSKMHKYVANGTPEPVTWQYFVERNHGADVIVCINTEQPLPKCKGQLVVVPKLESATKYVEIMQKLNSNKLNIK